MTLASKHITIVGMGGLGSASAELIVRMGARRLRIIDDDVVEHSNLDRQTLYEHKDIGRKKVEVAAEKLLSFNPELDIEIITQRLDESHVEELLGSTNVVLDGLDNNEARRILHKQCQQRGVPWVHAAVIGHKGQVLTVVPDMSVGGLFDKERQECSRMGVLACSVKLTAAVQTHHLIRLLLGDPIKTMSRIRGLDAHIDNYTVS